MRIPTPLLVAFGLLLLFAVIAAVLLALGY